VLIFIDGLDEAKTDAVITVASRSEDQARTFLRYWK